MPILLVSFCQDSERFQGVLVDKRVETVARRNSEFQGILRISGDPWGPPWNSKKIRNSMSGWHVWDPLCGTFPTLSGPYVDPNSEPSLLKARIPFPAFPFSTFQNKGLSAKSCHRNHTFYALKAVLGWAFLSLFFFCICTRKQGQIVHKQVQTTQTLPLTFYKSTDGLGLWSVPFRKMTYIIREAATFFLSGPATKRGGDKGLATKKK